MRTRRAGLVGLVMSGTVLVVAGGAWACVPGMDHSDGTGGTGSEAAATPVPGAPAPPGPEAAASAGGSAPGTPAMPSVPAASSSPVTGAGMYDPAPTASTSSTSSSGGGSQKALGVGLFAVGGILVLGGVAQMARIRHPQGRLTPVNP